ncbi:MAG: T9SS type A sorting domain-containing protein [Ignavibacteriae bacterium]|nr:T9SS type A sorting domain-containing protein [Ignavibacteriota bacterium]
MKSTILFVALVFLASSCLHAQSSANFVIEADLFDSGGLGNASPKSASFAMISIIAQSAARNSSTSTTYDLSSGVICLFCGKAGPVGVESTTATSAFFLGQSYPNPASAGADGIVFVQYSLSSPARISLRLRDLYGRVVATVYNGDKSGGLHTASLDVSDLTRGNYILELESPGALLSRMITVLR